jgi:GNAT superfamily N-acetyltransferase
MPIMSESGAARLQIQAELPGVVVRLSEGHRDDAGWPYWGLDVIRVVEGRRGRGLGKRALVRLTELADDRHLGLCLSPSDAWGSCLERLRGWYGRHGFIENQGETEARRLPYAMRRPPR